MSGGGQETGRRSKGARDSLRSPARNSGGSASAAVRIKICGLTRSQDALLAASRGADYLGFIFADSPRRVSPERAAEIVHILDRAAVVAPSPDRALESEPRRSERQERYARPLAARPLPVRSIERVGVFVNADGVLIRETIQAARLTMVQLHGDEAPEFCRLFAVPVIKALRARDRGIFDLIRRYDTEHILLEPYLPGKYGGTGVAADWTLAAEVVRAFPERKIFLAGGLEPGNVRQAVTAVRPFAVDASSHLESAPGIKDPEKLARFIDTVRKL